MKQIPTVPEQNLKIPTALVRVWNGSFLQLGEAIDWQTQIAILLSKNVFSWSGSWQRWKQNQIAVFSRMELEGPIFADPISEWFEVLVAAATCSGLVVFTPGFWGDTGQGSCSVSSEVPSAVPRTLGLSEHLLDAFRSPVPSCSL